MLWDFCSWFLIGQPYKKLRIQNIKTINIHSSTMILGLLPLTWRLKSNILIFSNEPASPRESTFGDSGLEVNEIEVTTETETTTQEITTEKIEATSLKENINDQTEVTITNAHKPRYISNGWFLFPDGSINQEGNPLYQTVQRFPAVNKPVLPSKTSYFSYPWHHFPQKWASEPYNNEVNSNNLFQFNNNFPFKYPYVYYSLNINNQDSVWRFLIWLNNKM